MFICHNYVPVCSSVCPFCFWNLCGEYQTWGDSYCQCHFIITRFHGSALLCMKRGRSGCRWLPLDPRFLYFEQVCNSNFFVDLSCGRQKMESAEDDIVDKVVEKLCQHFWPEVPSHSVQNMLRYTRLHLLFLVVLYYQQNEQKTVLWAPT